MKRAAFFAAWCLLFWCTSCATVAQQLRVREGQEQAVHIVWVEGLRRTDRPPLVRWIEGEALNCESVSGKRGFAVPGLGCLEGLTLSPLEVQLAWQGELSFAETVMVHEFVHVAKLRDNMNHAGPDWQVGGLIDEINLRLVEAGR